MALIFNIWHSVFYLPFPQKPFFLLEKSSSLPKMFRPKFVKVGNKWKGLKQTLLPIATKQKRHFSAQRSGRLGLPVFAIIFKIWAIRGHHAWLPPLLTIFDDLKGGSQAQFFRKKKMNFFSTFFLCTANKNNLKNAFYFNSKNIFHLLTINTTFNIWNCGS